MSPRGPGDAAGELGEHGRLAGRDGEAGLGGVLAVVQADGQHLPRRRGGGAQLAGHHRRPALPAGGRRPGGEGVPVVVDGLRVGAEPAAAVLLDVVGDLVPGVAGEDDETTCQVGDAHGELRIR